MLKVKIFHEIFDLKFKKKLLLLSKLDLLIYLNFDNGTQHIFILLHNCLSPDLSSIYIQSKLEIEISHFK